MTVKELIAKLADLPSEAEIWLSVVDWDCSAPLCSIHVQGAGKMVTLSDQETKDN